MTLDDSTRRQLRFSLFLQLAGFVMFSVAFIVKFASTGFDIVSLLLLLGVVLTVLALAFTRRQLRQ